MKLCQYRSRSSIPTASARGYTTKAYCVHPLSACWGRSGMTFGLYSPLSRMSSPPSSLYPAAPDSMLEYHRAVRPTLLSP